jgi:hypothetical protein
MPGAVSAARSTLDAMALSPTPAPAVPASAVPVCAADGMRMTATIVGWRCPLCGATEA